MKPKDPYSIRIYDPFAFPVPTPGQDPDDSRMLCVKFNESWLPSILGALESLRYPDTWRGTEDQQAKAVLQSAHLIAMFMLAEICEDTEMRLRQKPTNSCVLQASYDNGNTWNDVFDYAACFESLNAQAPQPDYVNLIADYNLFSQEMNNVYNDNPDNLTPSASQEVNNENLHIPLCRAAHAVVLAACAGGVERARRNDSTRDTIYAVGAAAFGIAAALTGGLALVPAAAAAVGISTGLAGFLAIAAGGAGAATSLGPVFDNTPTGIFENQEAQNDVICCMLSSFADSIPTRSEFENSLNGCSLSGDAADLAGVITQFLAADDIYQLFLLEIEAGYVAAQTNGLDLGTCPCDNWCYTWDFVADQGGWVAWGINGVTRAYHTPQGWKSGYPEESTDNRAKDEISIQVTGSTALGEAAVTVNYSNVTANEPMEVKITDVENNLLGEVTNVTIPAAQITVPIENAPETIVVRLKTVDDSSGAIIGGYIENVTISGNGGVNPFGVDNCGEE
jgi:hypothetical protein